MNVEMRKTSQGTEYWDTEEKKIRFVPAGKKGGFEVTKDPKSMLKEEGHNPKLERPDESFGSMNAEQLLGYVKDNNFEVPGNMKKGETIRKHIEVS
ncbi:MAG: hypothetical protein ACQEWF_01770 [Bacillota bacterium]